MIRVHLKPEGPVRSVIRDLGYAWVEIWNTLFGRNR